MSENKYGYILHLYAVDRDVKRNPVSIEMEGGGGN